MASGTCINYPVVTSLQVGHVLKTRSSPVTFLLLLYGSSTFPSLGFNPLTLLQL